jgi:hypothetical protein
MNPNFYGLPADAAAVGNAYENDVARFLAGDMPAEVLKARRVAHGVYEQRQNGTFMSRVRVAGGTLNAAQARELAALSREFGNRIQFVGGTALARTHLPTGRLSEDIDLIATQDRKVLAQALDRYHHVDGRIVLPEHQLRHMVGAHGEVRHLLSPQVKRKFHRRHGLHYPQNAPARQVGPQQVAFFRHFSKRKINI